MEVFKDLNFALELYNQSKQLGKTDSEILKIFNANNIQLHQDTTNIHDVSTNMANIQFQLEEFSRKYPGDERRGIEDFSRKIRGHPVCLDAKIEELANFLSPQSSINIDKPEPVFGEILYEILDKFRQDTLIGNYELYEYIEKNSFRKLIENFYMNKRIRAFVNTYGELGIRKINDFLTTMKPDLVDNIRQDTLDILDIRGNSILRICEDNFARKTITFIPCAEHKKPIKKGTIIKYENGDLDTVPFDIWNCFKFGKKIIEVEQKISGGKSRKSRKSGKSGKSRKSIKSRKSGKSGKSRKSRK